MIKVLMVCMGNICRSPMAEGVFRRMLESVALDNRVYVDSAGTHSYHAGAVPDMRGQSVAMSRGVDLSRLRARRVSEQDLQEFDYILAMDQENLDYLKGLCSSGEQREKVRLLLDFAPDWPDREVPDPYYGANRGFERVMDMIEASSEGLLQYIRERHSI